MQTALQDLAKKQADLRALRLQYTPEAAPVKQLQGELDELEHRQGVLRKCFKVSGASDTVISLPL